MAKGKKAVLSEDAMKDLLRDPLLGVFSEMGLNVSNGIATGAVDPVKVDAALDIFWGAVMELTEVVEEDEGGDDD